jgi:ADP-heptose:LPS heptosyltransferase
MITSDLKYELVPYTTGVGLEMSVGQQVPMFDHWISTSLTGSLTDLDVFADRSLDFIVGLGSARNYQRDKLPEAVRTWWKKIKFGGSLVWINDVREIPEQEILGIMAKMGSWDLAVKSLHGDDEDHLLSLVFVKKEKPGQTFSCDDELPDKAVCVIRYGAIGDCIVASSILPGLKRQGHHVVFNTQPTGYHVLKGNPHIDEFLMQDKNQIPNAELPEYWLYLKRKYGRVINLSETMEGAICSVQHRPDFTWPDEVRRQYRAANYYDFVHTMAGVPLPPEPSFHPTTREIKRAGKRRDKIGRDKTVMVWVLAGSSVHKRCPQMGEVLGYYSQDGRWTPGLLDLLPDLHIVFAGDETCRLLEVDYDNHPQVTCTSGKWGLRDTLTFIAEADIVIGPETGMVNAAGMMGVPTILFLSHTSEDTVAKHWDEYIALEPEGVECFPCYRLHQNIDSCNLIDDPRYGEVAECVGGVTVEQVNNAIGHYYHITRAERLAEAL